MDTTLKGYQDKSAQAEFVCIDSCDDKDGKPFRQGNLATRGTFTAAPKTEMLSSKCTPSSKRNMKEKILMENTESGSSMGPNNNNESKSLFRSALEYIFVTFLGVISITTSAAVIFGCIIAGHTIFKMTMYPHIDLDLSMPMNQPEVDMFFEKDSSEYKLRHNTKEVTGEGLRIQATFNFPIDKLDLKMKCGEPAVPKFSILKYGSPGWSAYCRWIIGSNTSIARECALIRATKLKTYEDIFGKESHCHIDFNYPIQEIKSTTSIMVPPSSLVLKPGILSRVRQAGAKVSSGIVFVLKRIFRSTKITYHRAVITLKEVINLTEPKVKFLGGAAQTIAKEKIWNSIKRGYFQFYRQLSALFPSAN